MYNIIVGDIMTKTNKYFFQQIIIYEEKIKQI